MPILICWFPLFVANVHMISNIKTFVLNHAQLGFKFALLELANVKLNCKYLISSIWPKLKQELVEKYIKLGPVLFHIIYCLLIISVVHCFILNEVQHNLNCILWFFICYVMWFYTPWPPSPGPCCYWPVPASNFLIGQAFSLPRDSPF